jgi:hypothetical protein
MNVSNLKEGMIVKNYKELCGLLGIEVKGGDSKRSQLRDISLSVDYLKDGNKFIINQIYDEPLMKTISRKRYIEQIEVRILNLILEKQPTKATLNGLLKDVGMVNKRYHVVRGLAELNAPELRDIKVDYGYMTHFFAKTHRMFKYDIDIALRNLIGKRFLELIKTKCIVTKKESYICTEKDLDMILNAEREVLNTLKADSLKTIIIRKQWRQFNRMVNAIISKQVKDFKYYYSCYYMIPNSGVKISDILTKYKHMYSEIDVNAEIMKHIEDLATNRKSDIARYIELEEEWKITERQLLTMESNMITQNDDYIESIMYLIDYVISIESYVYSDQDKMFEELYKELLNTDSNNTMLMQ